jgi:hypothetical protein
MSSGQVSLPSHLRAPGFLIQRMDDWEGNNFSLFYNNQQGILTLVTRQIHLHLDGQLGRDAESCADLVEPVWYKVWEFNQFAPYFSFLGNGRIFRLHSVKYNNLLWRAFLFFYILEVDLSSTLFSILTFLVIFLGDMKILYNLICL